MTDRQLAKAFFKLFDDHLGSFVGTRHAAENVYCPFCEPKGYDHWKDQTEHAPSCPYVKAMDEARKRFGK
jgi:hypothetical protein